jgi:flagellar biosynthesis chaperone FliJ
VQTELNNSKQKYNDSQAELNNTKNTLSTEQANNHLLTLQVTNLNEDIKHKDDRITDLEKRPNISSDDWTNDYSKRPTQTDFNKVKDERDQRPNISLEDYQKLLGIKNELDK